MGHGEVWRDQWKRLIRWRERVRQSRDEGRSDRLGTEGYRDEVLALFQAIWHLKDWFVNDPSFPGTKADVEAWLRQPDAHSIQIAADVANGSKHLTHNTRRRADGSNQTRNDVTIMVGVGVKHVFYITDHRDNQDYEALTLADRCLDEWKQYLSTVEVPPPPE